MWGRGLLPATLSQREEEEGIWRMFLRILSPPPQRDAKEKDPSKIISGNESLGKKPLVFIPRSSFGVGGKKGGNFLHYNLPPPSPSAEAMESDVEKGRRGDLISPVFFSRGRKRVVSYGGGGGGGESSLISF